VSEGNVEKLHKDVIDDRRLSVSAFSTGTVHRVQCISLHSVLAENIRKCVRDGAANVVWRSKGRSTDTALFEIC